jgi:F-type H+-transporting ATPase subunit alpha
MILYAAINGYLDDVPVNKVVDFETKLIKTMNTMDQEIAKEIKRTKELNEKTEEKMKKAIEEFKKSFSTE